MAVVETQRAILDQSETVVGWEPPLVHQPWEVAHISQESDVWRSTEIAIRREFGPNQQVLEIPGSPTANGEESESTQVEKRDIFIIPSSEFVDIKASVPGTPIEEITLWRDGKIYHVVDDAERVRFIARVLTGSNVEISSANGRFTKHRLKLNTAD